MMSPLFLLVSIVGVAVVWLLAQTVNVKPWVEQSSLESVPSGASFPVPPVKVGLGVFLAVATALFALTICAYFTRMMAADWRTFVFPSVLWLNTGLLIGSDLAMRSARTSARRAQMDRVRARLIAAGICSFAFLVVFFTAFLVAIVANHMIPGFTIALGFLLGGIVAPPDAVSTAALTKFVKIPKSTSAILEGESLLNDASSLIIFRFALAMK